MVASSSKTPAQALASAGFSSSLKFAPRLNKPKAAVKPAGTTFNAGVLEKQAEIHRSSAGAGSQSPGPGGPGSNGHNGAQNQMQAREQVQLGPDGRPLASAPSMTMAQEKRPKRDREEERLRQKRKKVSIVLASSMIDQAADFEVEEGPWFSS
jgi:hypothetical protein